MTFAVELGARPTLQFALAVATLGRPEDGFPVAFRVLVNDGGGEEIGFEEKVGRRGRNRWLSRAADLGRWAGQKVQLTLEARSLDGEASSSSDLFPLWGHPVVLDGAARPEQPDVLLISIDCLRPDHMGVYGYARDTTPHLDAFARDAVVFENAVSTSSWTLPSHMSMLTGLAPSFHGATRTEVLRPSLPYLPELLAEAGYETHAVVSSAYLSPTFGFERGFHTFTVLHRPKASQTVARARAILERAKGANLFLFLHVIDPHWDYAPPPPFSDRFGPSPPNARELLQKVIDRRPPSGAHEVEALVRLYDAEIAYVDHELGPFLDEVVSLRRDRQSFVIVTSDHGEAFYEHDYWQHSDTLYEEMIRVPLLIRWPDGRRGERVTTPVSLVDLAPTVLSALGLPAHSPQGMDLARIVAEEESSHRRTVSETAWHSEEATLLKIALRSNRLKYIATFATDPADRLSIAEMRQEELYDLATDPGEERPLDDRAQLGRFRGELEAYLRKAARFRSSHHEGDRIEIDELTRERLRSLGYLQ